jgi:hypothetical protein
MQVRSADLTYTPISCNLHQQKAAAKDVDFFRTSITHYGLLDVGEVVKVACLLTTAFGPWGTCVWGRGPLMGFGQVRTCQPGRVSQARQPQAQPACGCRERVNDPYPLTSHRTRRRRRWFRICHHHRSSRCRRRSAACHCISATTLPRSALLPSSGPHAPEAIQLS